MFPSQVSATLPPLPPPDPTALDAARQLVEQLPVESRPNEDLVLINAKDAVTWASLANPKVLKDEELVRLFAEKVTLEAKQILPTCIPEAKEALAESFSRHLSADDARQVVVFLATKAGQALTPTINAQPYLATLRTCTYRAIFPNLPRILDAAIESNDLRRRVNSGHERLP